MNLKIKSTINKYKTGTLFFLPFFVLFVVFVILPIFTAIGTSFTDYDLINSSKFIRHLLDFAWSFLWFFIGTNR